MNLIKTGRRITFISFALAMLCLLPVTIYKGYGMENDQWTTLGLAGILGFLLFSSLSCIGMLVWMAGEFRKGGNKPR